MWVYGGEFVTGNRSVARWKTRWGYTAEEPTLVLRYPEGYARWYGSGACVLTGFGGRVVVRFRWMRVSNYVTRLIPLYQREVGSMALKKIAQAAASVAGAAASFGDEGDWPFLIEMLRETRYPDGSPREPGALIVVADATGWRGCVSDKDNARTLWKTAAGLLDLLQALETALAEDDPTLWRQASAAKKKPQKRS